MKKSTNSRSSASRVLLTGCAGFIGTNLLRALLDAGHDVVCVDNLSTGKASLPPEYRGSPRLKFGQVDVSDLEGLRPYFDRIEIVVHQAALGSVPRSVKDPLGSNEANITGFLNLLWLAKETGVKRVVYASSSSVYGTNQTLPKVESQIGDPLSPYALTKLTNEHYARLFSELFGLETVGLRYFNVFGPHQDPHNPYAAVIPNFILALSKCSSPKIFGDGEQSRDFTFVEDVVKANLLAMTFSMPNEKWERFNVASGKAYSVNRLFSEIRRQLEKFNQRIGKVEPIYEKPRAGDVRDSLASLDHAKKVLGYSPAYDLISGLERAIPWYWQELVVKQQRKNAA